MELLCFDGPPGRRGVGEVARYAHAGSACTNSHELRNQSEETMMETMHLSSQSRPDPGPDQGRPETTALILHFSLSSSLRYMSSMSCISVVPGSVLLSMFQAGHQGAHAGARLGLVSPECAREHPIQRTPSKGSHAQELEPSPYLLGLRVKLVSHPSVPGPYLFYHC